MQRRAAALLLPLLVLGCAELRTPPPPPPPAGLVVGSSDPTRLVDPIRAAIEASAAAFADGGLSLAEHPDAVAQATAQLEYLVLALPRSQAYANMPPTVLRDLTLARDEMRGALGISPEADGERVMRTLLEAARALRANQEGAAAAALPAGLFRPGGVGSIRRFGEPGPLPQTALATTAARDAVAWMDTNQLWLRGREQDLIQMEIGNTTGGRGLGIGRP
jgi:hypothetical protein